METKLNYRWHQQLVRSENRTPARFFREVKTFPSVLDHARFPCFQDCRNRFQLAHLFGQD
jgi:hypothetical protein